MLLHKPRRRVEVYNDLDGKIVGIFRIVQAPASCQALVLRLRRTPYARREFERAFIPSADPVIRAQRAIVRSCLSFHHSALFLGTRSFSDSKHRAGGLSKAYE